MYILILSLLLSSCAPLPGTQLYPELTEAVELEDIDLTVTIGFEETSQFCNKKMTELGYEWMVAFNCLFNFCASLGCAVYEYDDGKINKCDVYVAWEFLLDHELRHCQGYKDVWY